MLDRNEATVARDPVPLAFTLTLVVISVAITFSTLTAESLWTDELFTRYFIDPALALSDVWQRMVNELHPPTYYLALRTWTDAFGASSSSLRAFSWFAFCVALLVPFTPFGRDVLGARRNTFVLLVATSFLLIRFAQEARSYELLALFALLTTLLNVLLQRRLIDGRPVEPACATTAAIVYPITALLHLYGVIFAGISLLYLFGEALWRRRSRVALLIFVIGSVTLLIELAWLYVSFPYVSKMTGGSHWITSEMLPRELMSFLVKAFSGNLLLGLVVLAALLKYGMRLWRSPSDRMLTAVVLLSVLLPVLASLHSPTVIDRVLIVLVPALFFVVSGLLLDLMHGQPDSRRPWIVFAIGVGLAAATLMQNITIKTDWEGTARLVAAFPSCKNAPVVASPAHAALAYPEVDAEPTLFLHHYAGHDLKVKLVPFNSVNLDAARRDACPIVAWITRQTPTGVERLLAGSGLGLSDFDSYWSRDAVVLFEPMPPGESAR